MRVAREKSSLSISGLNGFNVGSLFGSLSGSLELPGLDLNPIAGIDLPAGPFFRLEADDLDLDILGQQISGDFSIEFLQEADGRRVLRMAAFNPCTASSVDLHPTLRLLTGLG